MEQGDVKEMTRNEKEENEELLIRERAGSGMEWR